MPTRTNIANGVCAVALGGALALAFSPAAPVPAAYAFTGEELNAVEATIKVHMTNGAASTVDEEAAEDVISIMGKYKVTVDDLPTEYQTYVLKCQLFAANSDFAETKAELSAAQKQSDSLQKQVTKLRTQLASAQAEAAAAESQIIKTQVKITSVKAVAAKSGKVTLSWKASSPVTGMRYQIQYGTNAKKLGKSTTAKTTKKSLSNLVAGKTYTFQVRAYKKLSGKMIYGQASKKVSAAPLVSYAKGSYKVTADMLHVRKTTSKTSDLLVDISNGTRVTVDKVKYVKGVAWGKLTYRGQTGWVQMQYLKTA